MAFANIGNIARSKGVSAIQDKVAGIFDTLWGEDGSTILEGPDFSIESRAAHIQDPQRDWMFLVSIAEPRFSDIGVVRVADELIIRAKNFTMPQKNVTTHELNFYGKKQVIPIEVDYERTFNINFEESQDQFVLRNFNSWLNMFDYFSDVVTDGAYNHPEGTVQNIKHDFKTTVELYMYKYNGAHEGVKVTFYNAYPTSLGGATFGHDASSKISYDIAFAYDYFKIEKNLLVPEADGAILPTDNEVVNTAANFLGVNDERIRHGAEVFKKWGPIIAVKAGLNTAVTLLNNAGRGNEIQARYNQEPLVIGSDEKTFEDISKDPRYRNKLGQ